MKNMFDAAALALCAAMLTSCAGPAPTAEPSLKDAVGDAFTIGVAVNGEQMAGRDSLGVAIVKKHFNSLVGENCMKCMYIHPEEDRYDFAGADSLVAFAQANNMELVGHCLVWHSQYAPWFYVDSTGAEVGGDVLWQRIKDHITTIVSRYKGKIKGWDVCNEIIVEDGTLRDSPLTRNLGSEFIYKSLQLVHELDPDAEIYLNDYGMTNPGRRAGYMALIDTIRARGIRLDAFGLQGHMGMDFPDSAAVEQTLKDFEAKGLPVMISEWDMGALPTLTQSANVTIEDERPLADDENNIYRDGLPDSVSAVWNARMRMFWDIFLAHKDNIKRVCIWGVTDADTWKNDFPVLGRTDYPLVFDRQGRMKPFMKQYIDEVTKK